MIREVMVLTVVAAVLLPSQTQLEVVVIATKLMPNYTKVRADKEGSHEPSASFECHPL